MVHQCILSLMTGNSGLMHRKNHHIWCVFIPKELLPLEPATITSYKSRGITVWRMCMSLPWTSALLYTSLKCERSPFCKYGRQHYVAGTERKRLEAQPFHGKSNSFKAFLWVFTPEYIYLLTHPLIQIHTEYSLYISCAGS